MNLNTAQLPFVQNIYSQRTIREISAAVAQSQFPLLFFFFLSYIFFLYLFHSLFLLFFFSIYLYPFVYLVG